MSHPPPVEERFKGQSFSLTPAMSNELKAIAEERGWSPSLIAREALSAWLDQYRKTGQLTTSR